MKQTAISIQDLNGAWSQIGAGSMRGITPSNVELTSDAWGPKTATFDLTRETFTPWPDIGAYAPVEITVGGVVVWSGRVTDAPTNSGSRSISVHCEGWQAHLDDDQYENVYVVTDLTQFKDIRQYVDCPLTAFPVDGQVEVGGMVKLGWTQNAAGTSSGSGAWFNGTAVGVYLEIPRDQAIKKVVVQLRNSGGTPTGPTVYVRTADSPNGVWNGPYDNGTGDFNKNVNVISPTYSSFYSQTFTGDHCALALFVYNAGATYWPAPSDGQGDCVFFDSVQIFTDTAYESSNGSVLRGDTVVNDALDKTTVKLSSDRSLIYSTGTSFYVPEFAPSGPRTARQAIEAINAFYNFRTKVDEQRRFIYTDPDYEIPVSYAAHPFATIGRWGSSTFEDASSSSGEDLYNKVIVTGTGPDGLPVRAIRLAGQQAGVTQIPVDDITLSNPTFDSNVTNWAVSGVSSAIVRTTTSGEYESGGAGLKWDNGAGGDVPMGAFLNANPLASAGVFEAGVTYTLSMRLKSSFATSPTFHRMALTFGNGSSGDYTSTYTSYLSRTAFKTHSVSWCPKVDTPVASVGFSMTTYQYSTTAKVYVDSISLTRAYPTLVDKRDFTRAHTLDCNFMLTDASAERLGDIFLAAHQITPFKGSGQVVGHNGLREYLSGMPMAPERLLMHTGEYLGFDDRIHPDYGTVGRSGRLINVTYRPSEDTASFEIDNSRKDFDALLERIGVTVGQIR